MTTPVFIDMARTIYGIAHRRMNRKYKVEAIAEYLASRFELAQCPDLERPSNRDDVQDAVAGENSAGER